MSEPAGLERRFRRLLAWYPQPFRSEHEEEVLGGQHPRGRAALSPANRLPVPYAVQIAFAASSRDQFNADLIGQPTPGHITLLYLPLGLLTGWTILAAVLPRRSRPVLSSGPDEPSAT